MRATRSTSVRDAAAILVGAFLLGGCGGCDPAPVDHGPWALTSSMGLARGFFATATLPSGKVIVAGGQPSYTGQWATAAVELYDPATGLWTSAAPMGTARDTACSVLLPSGQLLVAGGGNPADTNLDTAEVYDEGSDTWTAVAQPMSAERSLAACVLLPSGKALVTGGTIGTTNSSTASADLYDPATGLFTPTGSMAVARYWHTATVLLSGKVLVAGGCTGGWPCETATDVAELYDPDTGTWSAAGTMPGVVQTHTATRLLSGKVLVAGGCLHYTACGNQASDRRAMLYDPDLGSWSASGSLAMGRADHVAMLLASGDVLVAGGSLWSGADASTEVYRPATGAWTPWWPTHANHGNGLGAARLLDGKWMVVGGCDPYNGAAELLPE